MKKTRLALALMAVAAALISCEKKQNPKGKNPDYGAPSNQIVQNLQIPLSNKNSLTERFAKILATSLSNVNMKQFIKNELLLAFDGDYEFLFAKVKNQNVTGTNFSFSQILQANSQMTTPQYNAFIDSIEQYYPLLQVAFLEATDGDLSAWNINQFVPLVGAKPAEEYAQIQTIKVYNSAGAVQSWAKNFKPTASVLAVGENERIEAISRTGINEYGNVSSNGSLVIDGITVPPVFITTGIAYLNRRNIMDAINIRVLGGGTSPGGPIVGAGCYRDDHIAMDRLKNIEFLSCDKFNDACNWFWDGECELKALVMAKSFSAPLTIIMHENRGAFRERSGFLGFGGCDPKVYDPNYNLLTWNLATDGNRLLFVWMEENNGSTQTATSTWNTKLADGTTVTTSLNYSYKKNDKLLGDVLVEYCNGNSFQYANTYLKFFVHR